MVSLAESMLTSWTWASVSAPWRMVVDVTANNETLSITLKEASTLLDEIVISASRTPERIFESPVSVERFGLKEIKNTTAESFYGDRVCETCKFPFIYKGVKYETCTNVDQGPYSGGYWCSTQTFANGNHVTGSWGYCQEYCIQGSLKSNS